MDEVEKRHCQPGPEAGAAALSLNAAMAAMPIAVCERNLRREDVKAGGCPAHSTWFAHGLIICLRWWSNDQYGGASAAVKPPRGAACWTEQFSHEETATTIARSDIDYDPAFRLRYAELLGGYQGIFSVKGEPFDDRCGPIAGALPECRG